MSRILTWLCNVAYLGALILSFPVLVYKSITQGKYRDGWSEKLFGNVPIRDRSNSSTPPKPAVWFHAVSVGEVLQLQQVVKLFRQQNPTYEIIVSCTTTTGRAVAEEKFPDCLVCYFPLDFSWAVKRALKRLNPSLVVLVELELWPNFIWETTRQQIPLALINGRISENSFRGYCKVKWLMSRLLPCFQTIATQSSLYSERLQHLGAASSQLHTTGSIKFDGVQTDRNNPGTIEIGNTFGLKREEIVFIAGSTQSPEEQYALDVYRQLKTKHPQLRLLIVPRHKERFEEVAQLILDNKFPLVRRSQLKNKEAHLEETTKPPVLMLDTLGELSACWGLADLAFVGGSLTNRGGQNMIEPAAYAAAVLFGPNTRNFKDVVDLLLAEEAAIVVHSVEQMREQLEQFLENPNQATQMGQTAQKLVLSQQGATLKTVQLLSELLPKLPQESSQAA